MRSTADDIRWLAITVGALLLLGLHLAGEPLAFSQWAIGVFRFVRGLPLFAEWAVLIVAAVAGLAYRPVIVAWVLVLGAATAFGGG